jgi:hypothetical protein
MCYYTKHLKKCYIVVNDTVHLCSMDKRKTNLMQLYIFIVAVGDALHVLGVFAHHQERRKTKPVVTPAASTRFAPPPPAQRPQPTAQNPYATGLVF